jgi:hypothetical protein
MHPHRNKINRTDSAQVRAWRRLGIFADELKAVAIVPPACCLVDQAKEPARGRNGPASLHHRPVRATRDCGLPLAR